jgi:hypothetical protein
MKTILVFFVNMIFFAGCVTSSPEDNLKQPANAKEVITQYVSARKGWTQEKYRIEPGKRRGELMTYIVVYLEDEKKAVPGGGESF